MPLAPTTMTCGPVLIQLLFSVGFCACGSVLLASLPPANMYMKPILFAGGVCFVSHACTHAIAFSSPHIGSGPGVAGLSAIQVKLLVPLRTVRILPSAEASTTVAPLPIADGAADIALLRSASSDAASRAATTTTVVPTPIASTYPNTTRRIISTSCGVLATLEAGQGSRIDLPRESSKRQSTDPAMAC